MTTGWMTASIADLAQKVGSGATPSGGEAAYKSAGTPLIRSMNVVFFGFKREGLAFLDSQQAAALDGATVKASDVLLNITGASIGRVTLAPADMEGARVNQHVCIIRPRHGVDARYLGAYLSSPAVQSMIWADNTGTTRQALTKQQILGFEVPVAPASEQRRIADKLDAVLTRVDAVNARLARVAPILKRFRQSVLAAATSGRLTEDWRSEHASASWLPRSVESLSVHISDGPFGSNLKSDDYTEQGARVVRLENIGHLKFDASKETFISMEKYETLRKHTLVKGDLLFSSFVDEEVRVCEFPADITEPTINKADCFCVRTDPEQVNRHFLAMRLACRSTYEELKELVHGATRPRINLRQLRRLEVMLPSLGEQAEIVRRVQILFAFANRLEARLQAAQTATERLTPALLAKAFRGELVPQDPNDEPASELLKRLAATNTAPATPKRRGRAPKAA